MSNFAVNSSNTEYNIETSKRNFAPMVGCDVFIGVVKDVILDDDNRTDGTIHVIWDKDLDPENGARVAKPLNPFQFQLPVVNEEVVIIRNSYMDQFFYLSTIGKRVTEQEVTDAEEFNNDLLVQDLTINVHESNLISVGEGDDESVYGTTFEKNDTIIPATLFEGDLINQNRFGSYVRLGSKNELNETPWSLDGDDGKPVISLRVTDYEIPEGDPQIEDPENDNAFIYLLSDQSIDLSAIDYSPEHADVEPMDSYVGSQCVIGADRLTFVTKGDDISISSMNKVSISTANWAVDFDVLMDQVKALAEQLDALCTGKATLTTGVGPTGPGTNAADTTAIVQEISGLEQ